MPGCQQCAQAWLRGGSVRGKGSLVGGQGADSAPPARMLGRGCVGGMWQGCCLCAHVYGGRGRLVVGC